VIEIVPMRSTDWESVRQVYAEGIESGDATFETEAPSWESWDAAHRSDCRLVARDGAELLGWAAVSPVSGRCVYGGVAEVSVYVGSGARGRGVGRSLLQSLIDASERQGIWTLQAGVFPENVASLRLHRGLGFRDVGLRERIGRLRGVWRDVVLLERRSPRV
jgi:L-amino acid N-acyltransferase YncA